MKKIGGFFELELARKVEYHKDAIRLNYGRNALEYILKAKQYKKVHLPYYICNSVLEPINKLDIKYEYYNIDNNFQMKLDLEEIKNDELLIYVNYFGICNDRIDELIELARLIDCEICIDNTQSFFSNPKEDAHTIYSARKFFGVPDGAYLYTDVVLDKHFIHELGYDKFNHLTKRIDIGTSEAYDDFRKISKHHSGQPIRRMSKLSQRILSSINYDEIKRTRLRNFKYLHKYLGEINELEINLDSIGCPMIYPFRTTARGLRNKLIDNGVFVARYWDEVKSIVSKDTVEYSLVEDLIPLPIDQRYGVEEMQYIINIILTREYYIL